MKKQYLIQTRQTAELIANKEKELINSIPLEVQLKEVKEAIKEPSSVQELDYLEGRERFLERELRCNKSKPFQLEPTEQEKVKDNYRIKKEEADAAYRAAEKKLMKMMNDFVKKADPLLEEMAEI
ncbi:hypothetical protein [Alkalicoccus urumqiensis]|uniref:Uncharacterized protein n=1 Tax=Alkalicoccus urumqiensis TaxID=1548213 RepID=A0A2P6ME76_ALKUR|nr:hypothetical protein [Alkalicoccus urumqiensis]PRO64566.1 hypothetical protein C6I21_13790 [Alkalicoccus urumqiensis]